MVCQASSFLNREDGKGHKVRDWGEVSKGSLHKLLCKVCNSEINVSKGFQAIEKHVSSEKHAVAILGSFFVKLYTYVCIQYMQLL